LIKMDFCGVTKAGSSEALSRMSKDRVEYEKAAH
jgi:hypothetical protein